MNITIQRVEQHKPSGSEGFLHTFYNTAITDLTFPRYPVTVIVKNTVNGSKGELGNEEKNSIMCVGGRYGVGGSGRLLFQ